VRRAGALLLGLPALVLLACPKPPDVVKHRVFDVRPGLLRKVAVAPFAPSRSFVRAGPEAETGAAAADLVARFLSEALRERGIATIAPSDLLIAFEGSGAVLPRQDPAAVAALAAREFGATAVVLGVVNRYRERSGEALGSTHPASVHFEWTFHAAPSGEAVWSAHFDQTQPTVTGNPLLARQYPSYGSRFLTAAELARWGVGRALDEVPRGLR
jgi:hypothetical protein